MTYSSFPADSPYISENQAAKAFGVPRSTLRNWRVGGYLSDWMLGEQTSTDAKAPTPYRKDGVERAIATGGIEFVLVGFFSEDWVSHPVMETETPTSGAADVGEDPREGTEQSVAHEEDEA